VMGCKDPSQAKKTAGSAIRSLMSVNSAGKKGGNKRKKDKGGASLFPKRDIPLEKEPLFARLHYVKEAYTHKEKEGQQGFLKNPPPTPKKKGAATRKITKKIIRPRIIDTINSNGER